MPKPDNRKRFETEYLKVPIRKLKGSWTNGGHRFGHRFAGVPHQDSLCEFCGVFWRDHAFSKKKPIRCKNADARPRDRSAAFDWKKKQ